MSLLPGAHNGVHYTAHPTRPRGYRLACWHVAWVAASVLHCLSCRKDPQHQSCLLSFTSSSLDIHLESFQELSQTTNGMVLMEDRFPKSQNSSSFPFPSIPLVYLSPHLSPLTCISCVFVFIQHPHHNVAILPPTLSHAALSALMTSPGDTQTWRHLAVDGVKVEGRQVGRQDDCLIKERKPGLQCSSVTKSLMSREVWVRRCRVLNMHSTKNLRSAAGSSRGRRGKITGADKSLSEDWYQIKSGLSCLCPPPV